MGFRAKFCALLHVDAVEQQLTNAFEEENEGEEQEQEQEQEEEEEEEEEEEARRTIMLSSRELHLEVCDVDEPGTAAVALPDQPLQLALGHLRARVT